MVKAPLKSGDKVGTPEVYCDGKKVGSTPLVVHENIEKGWFLSRFYISNRATIAIGVILVLWHSLSDSWFVGTRIGK